MVKEGTKSQWVIDPKVYVRPTFHTEYQSKIGDQAPDFVYKRMQGPPKNRSHGLQEGAKPYPPSLGFQTTYKGDYVPEKTMLAPGYEKREAFKVKQVQVKLGTGEGMMVTQPYSHAHFAEVDMRLANVRNKRTDGLSTAGIKITTIPPYNIIPGIGGDHPGSRYVFDAYQDHTNKFRDTRRFAKMNNPDVPGGSALNLLTGEVLPLKRPPPVELNPRGAEAPPLHSLGQVRPPTESAGSRPSQCNRSYPHQVKRGGGGVAEALGYTGHSG